MSGTSNPPEDGPRAGPVYVVQLHQARNLHHDLRLEIDGVLVSWAVPKGPSEEVGVKRLAVRVPDHELAHASVQGVLGSGWVEIWDSGTFSHLTERRGVPLTPTQALAGGHLKLRLHGRRLTGVYALHRTRMGGEDRNWLLVRVAADDDIDATRDHEEP